MNRVHIKNGRLIDPANAIDAVTDLYLADGLVAGVGKAPAGFQAATTIDARDKIVCPGLIDLAVALREPGQEHKGTIASETAAAVANGITSVVCPPDTDPIVDTEAVVELILHQAKQSAKAMVLPLGALTLGLAGEQLSEMHALKGAGVIGLSNANQPLTNTLVARRAFEYAATHDLTVFIHANDPSLSGHGCAHEGPLATRLGLPGIPEAAETVAVARDLELIEQTGVRAHFGRLSTNRALHMIARARHDGLSVTCDVAAHHLYLTEVDIRDFDSACHLLPPLRSDRDRDGLRDGLNRGMLDAICSDHQPHEPDAKQAPFSETEPGLSGLDTLLPLVLRLADEGVVSLSDALAKVTVTPADILGLNSGRLHTGAPADVCIFDPKASWFVGPETLHSRGHNTPFMGWEMHGRATQTIVGGRLVFDATK
jgi:dihydroorotase